MKEQDILKARIRYLEQMVSALGREAAYLSTQMPILDCRVCEYAQWCDREADQLDPDELMCQEAILRYCEPDGEKYENS